MQHNWEYKVLAWLCSVKDLWGKWGIRLATSVSLPLHIVVLLLADFRRYNDWCPVWSQLLWLAYQALDYVGGYALGHLSLDGNDAATAREQLLVAFWAPFLLLHLGGPDNLSAYSLDDDNIGWRKAFGGVPKAASALYVVLTNIWLVDNVGLLRPASIIMFAVGFLRFFENVVAMVRALMRKKKASDAVSPSEERRPSNAMLFDSSVPEEDLANSGRRRAIFSSSRPLDELLKKVKKPTNNIYDKVYTKAGQVDTWGGYLLRLLSPVATFTAFILFGLYPKECLQHADITITYILLSAALILDLVWLLAALASTHALEFVRARPWFPFHHQILCRGWWDRLNRFALRLHPGRLVGIHPTTYWSSCLRFIGRRDLLLECTRAPGCIARLWTSIFGEDAVWCDYRAWRSSSHLSDALMKLLFERIKERFEVRDPPGENAYDPKEIRARWGQVAVGRRDQSFDGINLDFFGNVFQEDMLLWHIATTIYLYSNNQQQRIAEDDVKTKRRVGVIEAVSEYLMFLAAARPHMLPEPPLPRLYEVTQRALKEVYKKADKVANDGRLCCASAKKKLADILLRPSEQDYSNANRRFISYAARLASALLKAQRQSKLEHVVNLVFDVWVDKLLYAAIHFSRESHARQLGKGGELVTIVWITAEYAGVFEIGETGKPTSTTTNGDTGTDTDNGDDPGPTGTCIIKRPKCPVGEASCCFPKEKETCHCHQHPLEPVCPDTMKDYYCCTQDYYYC